MIGKKVYLGDAVYAEYDGHGIVLTTQAESGREHRIVLEDSVLMALETFKTTIIDWLSVHYVDQALAGNFDENT